MKAFLFIARGRLLRSVVLVILKIEQMRAALAISTLLFAVAGCSSHQPQPISCNEPSDLSTLSGIYESSEKLTINQFGPINSSATWNLKFDKKGHITGVKSWKSDKNVGHNATGAKVRSDSEALIGLIKNCKIALVETNENGMGHAELMKDQSITVSMLQSGDKPVVNMMTLVKSK